MGYPMTYKRVVNRNNLDGDYADRVRLDDLIAASRSLIRDDLRRLEKDQRDDQHLEHYAEKTGLTREQVKSVLDLFFEGDW